ncbi:MAG: hypothetical protein JWP59_3427 [Massilia sp.]|nr:hypothetical protein [Massilia sp.]
MLIQIISHTPLYVWAILAFLVSRGVLAMREREMEFRKLFIIPLVMLALSLQDIAHKFGAGGLPLAAWAIGTAAVGTIMFTSSRARIAAGSTAGSVRVAGSRAPLVLMMAIFMTKYATAVVLAMQPALAHQASFVLGVCLLFGAFNGYFLGRLGRDAVAFQDLAGRLRNARTAA